jgi:hypothetical protein
MAHFYPRHTAGDYDFGEVARGVDTFIKLNRIGDRRTIWAPT